MLVAIPVLLLTITVFLVWFFALVKLRPGTIWLFTAVAVLLAWGAMILVGITTPEPIIIQQYLPAPNNFTNIVLAYNEQTWVVGFLLLSLLTAVLFSEAKHLDSPDYIRKISGSILLTAIALLAVMADSLLTFVLAWALIDLIEFGVLAVLMGDQSRGRGFVSATTSILFRVIGIFLLLFIITITPPVNNQPVALVFASPYWGLIIFLILFRMGTLPLFQPYTSTPAYQRGIVTILRIIPIATTYAFIQDISGAGNLPAIPAIILFFVLIAILWGSISWFSAENELKGRPFFLFSMAGLGLLAFLSGNQQSLTGLSVLLFAGGGGLFLYSPKLKKVNAFLIILIISLLSLPYSPSASISQLFAGEGSVLLKIGVLVGLAFLITGLIKHGLTRSEFETIPEQWMRLFHITSLYFIALAPWLLVLLFWKEQNQYLSWWVWIPLTVICILIMIVFFLLRSRFSSLRQQHVQVNTSLETLSSLLGGLLKFTWLSNFAAWLGGIITQLVTGLAKVMEGDGGILWSFLFIALLLSLFLAGQVP